jgi:hypothetical protein
VTELGAVEADLVFRSNAAVRPTTDRPAAATARSSSFSPPEHEGWWHDPTGRHEMRYFDRTSWTWKIETNETSVSTRRVPLRLVTVLSVAGLWL